MACKCPSDKLSLDAGKLRHRVTFQSVTQTSDSAGGYTESWATAATVWASIEPVSAYERFVGMQTETHTTHKVMCRYNSAITTAKRMSWDGRLFDVVSVLDIDGRHAALEIKVIEGTL